MALQLNRPYGYSRMQCEDPDEVRHRRAQFLIYKVLQKADARSRPSWLRVKVLKLKIKIGKIRLKKLRKRFSSTVFLAKPDFCKHINHLCVKVLQVLATKREGLSS